MSTLSVKVSSDCLCTIASTPEVEAERCTHFDELPLSNFTLGLRWRRHHWSFGYIHRVRICPELLFGYRLEKELVKLVKQLLVTRHCETIKNFANFSLFIPPRVA